MTDTKTALPGMLNEEDFLQHVFSSHNMSEDEFLEHYGKKGMKWGVRKAEGSGPSNRELNKASRAKDRADAKATKKKNTDDWDNEIDSARSRIAGGQGRKDVKAAKQQYKADKQALGSREAKKALNAVKNRVATDEAVAGLAKSGKETRNAVIFAVGASVVAVGLRVANEIAKNA